MYLEKPAFKLEQVTTGGSAEVQQQLARVTAQLDDIEGASRQREALIGKLEQGNQKRLLQCIEICQI